MVCKLYTEDEEKPKKEEEHSKLVVLISKRTYIQGLSWAARQEHLCIYVPFRILKLYVEALTVFRHIYHPDGLNSTLLSQGCVLRTAPRGGTWGQKCFTRTGDGDDSPVAQV